MLLLRKQISYKLMKETPENKTVQSSAFIGPFWVQAV